MNFKVRGKGDKILAPKIFFVTLCPFTLPQTRSLEGHNEFLKTLNITGFCRSTPIMKGLNSISMPLATRKLCHSKDDRAMH